MNTNLELKKLLFGFLALLIVFSGSYLRFINVEEALHTPIFTPDGYQYYKYAYNLKYHGVYSNKLSKNGDIDILEPDAYRPPGYPLLITPFINKDDLNKGLQHIKRLQALLSVLTMLILGYLSWRLFGRLTGIIVLLLVSINPHLISANSQILTEPFFTFLLSILVSSAYFCYRTPSRWRLFICGIIIGVIALVKPSAQYILLPIAVFLVWNNRNIRVKQWIVLLFGFALVVSPWFARNIIVLDSMTDSRVMNNSLIHGSYIDLKYNDDPATFGYPYRADPELASKIESTSSALNTIKQQFIEHPIATAKWYLIDKIVVMWRWGFIQGSSPTDINKRVVSPYEYNRMFIASDELAKHSYPLLVISGGILCVLIWLPHGLFGFPRESLVFARLISLVIIYFVAITILVAPFPRYTMPLRPVLFILSTVFWVLLISKLKGAQTISKQTS